MSHESTPTVEPQRFAPMRRVRQLAPIMRQAWTHVQRRVRPFREVRWFLTQVQKVDPAAAQEMREWVPQSWLQSLGFAGKREREQFDAKLFEWALRDPVKNKEILHWAQQAGSDPFVHIRLYPFPGVAHFGPAWKKMIRVAEVETVLSFGALHQRPTVHDLCSAIDAGREGLIEAWLPTVDRNERDTLGRTLLMHAVTSHNAKLVQTLLDLGVDREARNDWGDTAALEAVCCDALACLKVLWPTVNREVQRKNGRGLALSAAECASLGCLQFILEQEPWRRQDVSATGETMEDCVQQGKARAHQKRKGVEGLVPHLDAWVNRYPALEAWLELTAELTPSHRELEPDAKISKIREKSNKSEKPSKPRVVRSVRPRRL